MKVAHMFRGPTTVLLLLALISGCTAKDPSAANGSSASANTQPAAAAAPRHAEAMVVTANPHATRAGEAILRAGGTAADAAVAIEAVLSLVEPQSSGLGGGGFLVYLNAADSRISVYDGRETAPAGASPEMFLRDDGEPYGYLEAKNSGLSIGVPGAVAMLEMAQSNHGSLPWEALFDDAIALAEGGFDVSPRLRRFLEAFGGRMLPQRAEDGPLDAYQYFRDGNGNIRDRLYNAAYADTLRSIRAAPGSFYTGAIAEAIVAAAAIEPRAGSMSLEDLENYQARRHEPLCVDYRRWQLCGPPPPSSWIAVGMALGILESTDFPGEDRLRDWSMFTEAQRLSYADRDQFVADDRFVAVPISGMLNPTYLESRAALISDSPAEFRTPGDPWAHQRDTAAVDYGRDTTIDYAGTTHFVVIDAQGNVASMTASVESIFGSTRMAGGMFLNNQLTDFAKQPRDADGVLVANHAAPGKHPRSSMSPTIVLDRDGAFHMATGSPGGNSIIAYTLKTLVGVLDWGLTAQEAVDLPNLVARGDTVRIEQDRAAPELVDSLRRYGFKVKESAGENSGLSVVVRRDSGDLEGGVDPRREGTIARIPPGN